MLEIKPLFGLPLDFPHTNLDFQHTNLVPSSIVMKWIGLLMSVNLL